MSTSVPLYVIFLQSSRPPRDLPSFPTRRSSDLRSAFITKKPGEPDSGKPSMSFTDWITVGTEIQSVKLMEGFPDRKSTRLNSSHTVISYAVFCLKKKKKKQTTL